jgi:site-specific DNA recombinase
MSVGSRRVVLYGRTSDDSSEGRSVDDQLSELRRWAASTGRTVVAELRDDGISASRYAAGKARPDWQRAMELISTGQAEELAVWEVSRSTRDRAVWAALFAALLENRVMLVVGGKVHDPSDPDDSFMLDLGAALAVRESALLSKRLQRGVDARAAAGRPHGSMPYGYRRVIDPNTGSTIGREPHPEHAAIVQEIIQRLLARQSADSIAADLNRRGVPAPTADRWFARDVQLFTLPHQEGALAEEIRHRIQAGETPKKIAADLSVRQVPKPKPAKWRGGNLAKLGQRPTYAGLRVYRGDVLPDVKATWTPLITIDEWGQLQALFGSPERDKFRNSTATKHLGTGLYRCGREGCDGVMRVTPQRPGRPNSYNCRACFRTSRRQDWVDDQVQKLIIARLSKPDVLEVLTSTRADDEVEAAAAEVKDLKEQLREARERVDAGELTLEDLAFFRKRWERRLKAAEERARPRWLPSEVFDIVGPDAPSRWARAVIGTKRTVLDALFTVTIHPAGPGNRRGFDPDLIKVEWRGGVG